MIKEFCDICKVEIDRHEVLNPINTPIDKDPTGGAKEKRLKNIRHWEEVKGKNVKRSD